MQAPAVPAAPSEGSEADTAAISGGVAFVDGSLAVAGEANEGLRLPNVNMGALRVLGGVTTFTGAAFTTYSAYQNYHAGNYNGLAINGVDLGVATTGLLYPPALPFSIGYGIGRALSDLANAISKIGEPDLLEQVQAKVDQE